MSSDRVTKVTVGRYDQVIAMTQYLINSGFSNLYLANQANNPPEPFTLADRGDGQLKDCLLDAPAVMVDIVSGSTAKVIYYMKFLQGTCLIYRSTDTKDNSMTNDDMTGWVLAFPVDLKFSDVSDPKKILEIKSKITKPGNYTIQQLLVDMSTADLANFDYKSSTIGGPDWIEDETHKNFQTLLMNTLGDLFSEGELAIGYVAQAQDPTSSDHPATFMPTGVTFQTYEWQDQNGQNPGAGLTGNSRLNYILYEEMTDNRPMPTSPYEVLSYSGNWTDGTFSETDSSTKYGTFAMSANNFLNRYLFPKLRVFNAGLEPYVDGLTGYIKTIDAGFKLKWSWFTNISIGSNPGHPDRVNDTYYDFKPQANTPNTWEFTSSYTCPQLYDEAGADGALGKIWGNSQCSTTNTLTFTPGSSQIIINGSSMIHFYMSLKNVTTADDSLTWNCTWKITLNLQSVNDGGLQITVDAPAPTLVHGSDWKVKNLGVYQTYVEQWYAGAMTQFTKLEQDLASDLAGQEKFYFPASGQLFFNNPILNHEGDLLCELQFNGSNDVTAPVNPSAPQRANPQGQNYNFPTAPSSAITGGN
ncbi:hypothetical protein F5884DRAFT_738213 [Xylogone sp. PMI_703]|nr:hypothetical protein F5884DRAFT_738213 [Xylogone sp. PMI_703]